MRCKYCNQRLQQNEYGWDEILGEFTELGVHSDGKCVDLLGVDRQLDPTGYDYLSDFEE